MATTQLLQREGRLAGFIYTGGEYVLALEMTAQLARHRRQLFDRQQRCITTCNNTKATILNQPHWRHGRRGAYP